MRLKRNLILGAMFMGLFATFNSSVAFAGTWGGTKPNWTYSDSKPESWQLIDGKWYYFNEKNITFTGILAIKDKQYYFSLDDGAMVVNQWVERDGAWLYCGADGALVKNSWVSYNGKWYYLGDDYKMLKNTTTPDGYYVNHDGEWAASNTAGTTSTTTTTSESNTAKASNYYSSAFNFNLEHGKGSSSLYWSKSIKKPQSFGAASSISFDVDGLGGDGELVLTFLENGYGTDIGSEVVYSNGSHTINIDEKTTSVRFEYKSDDPYHGERGTVKITNFRFSK